MKNIFTFIILALFVQGCSTLTQSEIEQKRETLNQMSDKAIAGLTKKDPALKKELKSAVAYAVANMKVTKVPVVGAGGGEGVLVDSKTNQHYYFTVSRLDIGGGWGIRSYKALLVVHSQEVLEKIKTGLWKFEAGVEVSAGTNAAATSADTSEQGFSMHILADGGASATVSARVIHASINTTLNYTPSKEVK